MTEPEPIPTTAQLNGAIEEFDRHTRFEFDRVTDYERLAEYCALHGWPHLARVFYAAPKPAVASHPHDSRLRRALARVEPRWNSLIPLDADDCFAPFAQFIHP